jgi:hypothetical protein
MDPLDFKKKYPEVQKIKNPYGHEDLEGFAKYIGVEYEDLLELQEKNFKTMDDIDFDDRSR